MRVVQGIYQEKYINFVGILEPFLKGTFKYNISRFRGVGRGKGGLKLHADVVYAVRGVHHINAGVVV